MTISDLVSSAARLHHLSLGLAEYIMKVTNLRASILPPLLMSTPAKRPHAARQRHRNLSFQAAPTSRCQGAAGQIPTSHLDTASSESQNRGPSGSITPSTSDVGTFIWWLRSRQTDVQPSEHKSERFQQLTKKKLRRCVTGN